MLFTRYIFNELRSKCAQKKHAGVQEVPRNYCPILTKTRTSGLYSFLLLHNSQIPDLMKIRLAILRLFHAEGQSNGRTDRYMEANTDIF
jgi:hypothetical protein